MRHERANELDEPPLYSEDLQHMLVLESLLQSRGQQTVLSAPSHLQVRWGKPVVNGRPVGSVIRFYPGEWFPLLPNVAAWHWITFSFQVVGQRTWARAA